MCQMNKDYPQAYHGDGNFIFVSYSHIDSDRVMADIRGLQIRDVNIWYDEGLALGLTWNEDDVKEHIKKDTCVGVVFYVSGNFLSSPSVWQEAEMVKNAEKNYCVVMLADAHTPNTEPELYKMLNNQLINTYTASDCAEDPQKGMSRNTFIMLMEMFDENRTYAAYSDPRRFDSLVECFERWGYHNQKEIFPLCNVKHNGHIEYLPSLLAITPFNFTFIMASLLQKHVDNSLNKEGKQPIKWMQYSHREFCGAEDVTQNTGIVVCFPRRELASICPVLTKRSQAASRSPLIIDIQIENLDEAEHVIEEAKEQLRQWDSLSSEVREDQYQVEFDDFFVFQTGAQSSRARENPDQIASGLPGVESWRVLLSDKEYRDTLLERAKQSDFSQAADWLFSQLPISEDLCYRDERDALLSDSALLQDHDRITFRTEKHSWECEYNV